MTEGTRIGADVGGTFTDVIVESASGQVIVKKLLSTPPSYELAVVEAVDELVHRKHLETSNVTEIVHGTTVATNTVLQRRGARTALVTTAGFRDVLELRRMRMPHLYDYFWTKPEPLVPRSHRLEITERVTASGRVITPVDEAELVELVEKLRELDVESVAVCFLHAHLYPAHEERIGEVLRNAFPGLPVSLSSEVLREQQEYERTATVVANAYIRPVMSKYVSNIRAGLRDGEIEAPLMIMQSSGGVMSAEDAAVRPVYALESGPAAGVIAALGFGELLGLKNVLAFDMGGTTAKASLIEGGHVTRSQEYELGASLSASSRLLRGTGELIRLPTIDIAEVSAGGGSVAWLDAAGGLQVGPQSAGAVPGAACYGLGGVEPTVTDANVVLGYIPEGPLASGDLQISRARAEESLEHIAGNLGLSKLDVARGIHQLANARMMRALRNVSTERGRNISDFALLAYGGSGPIHAPALAHELGIPTVVIPPCAGLFSAAGLLYARSEVHDVRYCRIDGRFPDLQHLQRLHDEMHARLTEQVETTSNAEWIKSADMRYQGQSWSITVDFPGDLDETGVENLVARFEDEHDRLYGTRFDEGAPVEIRALRVGIVGPQRDALAASLVPADGRDVADSRREADFGADLGMRDVPVLARESITRHPLDGPRLIDEYDTTVVVPRGWTVRAGPVGALVLDQVVSSNGHRATERRGTAPLEIKTQLLANGLSTIADEMATTIFRTACSAVVRDAMDFSAALCGPTGETVAQAVTIPLQLGSIPAAMKALIGHYAADMRPGDIFIGNDPFDGATHTPDIFVIKPVFLDDILIGFGVTVAHHGDIGGRVPGTAACDNTEIFHEGLRIPWVRLYEAGTPVAVMYELIRANVRIPRETIGDLNAQIAACNIGERGLRDLALRHGNDELIDMMSRLLDHTERLLRREISTWPDGEAQFTDYLDSDGIETRDVAFTVKVTIEDDEVTADFSESAPMVRGSLNCTHSFAEAAVFHCVMAACETTIPSTAGATRPIHVITRPGTVTHVVLPGASSMRGIAGYRISDVVNGALAQLVPHRIPAAGEGGSTLAFFAGRENGEPFLLSELVVGTWGGRPVADGNDGLANPCASIANISVEVAEENWPILVERYGLVQDSGGAGRYRGGLGLERAWRVLANEALLQVRSDRQIHRPYGLSGGLAGGASSNTLVRADGQVASLPTMFGVTLNKGDVFHHILAGGGGWGDPLDRDITAVARDVVDGKVSIDAARGLYAVIISAKGIIDYEHTRRLRDSRRAAGSLTYPQDGITRSPAESNASRKSA